MLVRVKRRVLAMLASLRVAPFLPDIRPGLLTRPALRDLRTLSGRRTSRYKATPTACQTENKLLVRFQCGYRGGLGAGGIPSSGCGRGLKFVDPRAGRLADAFAVNLTPKGAL